MQATGAQEREIMRVKRDPDKQSELWATCPCDGLRELSFQRENAKGLNMRSEYSEARSWTTRPKRRRVTRAGVAEELQKKE